MRSGDKDIVNRQARRGRLVASHENVNAGGRWSGLADRRYRGGAVARYRQSRRYRASALAAPQRGVKIWRPAYASVSTRRSSKSDSFWPAEYFPSSVGKMLVVMLAGNFPRGSSAGFAAISASALIASAERLALRSACIAGRRRRRFLLLCREITLSAAAGRYAAVTHAAKPSSSPSVFMSWRPKVAKCNGGIGRSMTAPAGDCAARERSARNEPRQCATSLAPASCHEICAHSHATGDTRVSVLASRRVSRVAWR